MRALITGITGQDGSYLAELLLSKGYEVHGIIRRSSSFHTGRIDHIFDRLHLHYGDLCDGMGINSVISRVKPQEIYNLGAQSHVKVSFEQPVYSVETVALGTLHVLEAARLLSEQQHVRVYQASSSEMYGDTREGVQDETTEFRPQSPYACAKVCAYHLAQQYRQAYGLFVANGILFNHESERRGETFVTRKSPTAAKIKPGQQDKIQLGNLGAVRDWGYAPDYVRAMWLMLQQDKPDDFVVATGKTFTVANCVHFACKAAGLPGSPLSYVEYDARYERPAEVKYLCGDATKARDVLGWSPSVTFADMIRRMVAADL